MSSATRRIEAGSGGSAARVRWPEVKRATCTMRRLMRSARLYGPRDLRIENQEEPAPGPGEALIRIEACGVCPSDVRGYLGTRATTSAGPRTPGHEWAGTIEALGPDTPPDVFAVGTR